VDVSPSISSKSSSSSIRFFVFLDILEAVGGVKTKRELDVDGGFIDLIEVFVLEGALFF